MENNSVDSASAPKTLYSKPEKGEEIVISGMSGKLAAADDIYHFRENLYSKVNMVTGNFGTWQGNPELPEYIGKINGHDKFDLGCFGVTSRQADSMDPQLRISLEKTYEAILDAGYSTSDLEGTNTAVYAASFFSETEKAVFYEILSPSGDSSIGVGRSMIPKRISYILQLKGPAFQLDTACCSALYAVEHAYTALRNGYCERAIICSTNLCLYPILSLQFARLGILSKDGRCKSFDHSANGYVRSEGIATILLEKVKTARRFYAEVIYVKTNCDGFKEEGITFPLKEAQQTFLKEFYDDCKIDTSLLTYLEAHGTGTKVGDPQELNALDEILCKNRKGPLYIGSVKSNVGHLEAASALSSIIKVVIGMETGIMPPNIHYTNPNQNIEALITGRMKVITENMPLPNNMMAAINSFGIGGSKAHILLGGNPKSKVNNGQPNDNLPRLICVSSRTAEGLERILDDFSSRNCDAEFTYLIQQAFRHPTLNEVFRGYGIFTKNGEITRSFKQLEDINRQQLCLIYGNVNREILKSGHGLIEIPVFSRTIQSVQNILLSAVNVNLLELFKNSTKQLFEQILGAMAIQIGLADILKKVKLSADHITGIGTGLLIAAYAKNELSLEQTVMGALFAASHCRKGCRELYEVDKDLELICVKYLNNQKGIDTSGLRENKYDPKHIISIIICDMRRGASNALPIVKLNSQNYIMDIMTSLGSLYTSGFSLNLAKLYPPIALPVSRGTPMISPLIRWSHKRSCKVHHQENETTRKSTYKTVQIIPESIESNSVVGHVVDGRNLFPAAGYLSLVWTYFAKTLGKFAHEMKIVFEDVKFMRVTTVPKEDTLQLTICIARGRQNFEIIEGEEVIVTGRIFEQNDEQILTNLSLQVTDNDGIWLTEKDIYKELRLRGYQYSGKFRNLKKCKLDLSQAEIAWESDWVAFIDCFLQFAILREDTRETYLPVGIQQLIIDGLSILNIVSTLDNRIPVLFDNDAGVIRTIGLEMRSVAFAVVARSRTPNPVLEVTKFISNITQLDAKSSVRSFLQLMLENVNVVKVSVVEIVLDHQEPNDLLFPVIQEALNDIPLVQQTITILTDKDIKTFGVNVRNRKQTKPNCLLLVTSNLLETINEEEALNIVKDAKGFIISREKTKVDLNKFVTTSYTVLCSHTNDLETLVLLRPTLLIKQTLPRRFLDLTNAFSDLQWLPKLQNMLRESSKVILYAQNELSGILGLITCLKKEYATDNICCVFTIDSAPKFDPELNFYKRQLKKNLSINIWKDGAWGTYRYLILPQLELVQSEHCYVTAATRGDLSTISWTEGKCFPEDIDVPGNETIYVYCAALNFRDFMTATGRITPDIILKNRVTHEYLQGLEFAGRNSRGERIAGLSSYGSLMTITHSDYYYPIPDHWTMEDAATVTLVYGALIQIFIRNSNPKPGESILIHSGTTSIGLAAINLSLYFGFVIFVTVDTSQKRDFIKKTYPQMKEEHIGSSKETSFENMIEKHTNGRGVDYVLNSLSEEKLLASARCLAKGGSFCEIVRYDLLKDNAFSLYLLEKDARFVGISFDTFLNSPHNAKYILEQLTKLINCGAIKPLPRKVFPYKEINKAFRFMGTGKNIGKLVMKVRDEEADRICRVSKESWEATPKFHCISEKSYIICGGFGEFGLELADLLVLRGAKRLVLTGRSGLYNGYQHYRIGIWKNYGVKVLTNTLDAANEEDCVKLLNLANELGPIDGIFNLAAVLKDALFENQTIKDFKVPLGSKVYATTNLDRISRQLCPHLRYFVVFSSSSSGQGNAGQTNYGMANSVMERICEKRKREGYPGLAIQWGAIGEIGLAARTQRNDSELGLGGTLQQSVSSCLQVLDKLLKQKEAVVSSMIPAAKKQTDYAENMFDAVINILGITNLKTTNMQSTFPELGMDSAISINIKQVLEYQYGVLITAQDIKSMTLSKLKCLSDTENSNVSVPN